MELPADISEEYFLEIVTKIVNILSRKFKFGIHDIDDLKQQGFLFALRAMNSGKYNPNMPLDNFLYIHIRNRYINYQRDNHYISELPCVGCVFHDPKLRKSRNKCAAFKERQDCKKFAEYEKRISAKKRIVNTVDLNNVDQCMDGTAHNDVVFDELEQLINQNLPADLRSDYLRLRQQFFVPKDRREKVQNSIKEILATRELSDAES